MGLADGVTLGLAEPCPGRNNLTWLGMAPWQVSERKPDNRKPLSSLKPCEVFKLLYFRGSFEGILVVVDKSADSRPSDPS